MPRRQIRHGALTGYCWEQDDRKRRFTSAQYSSEQWERVRPQCLQHLQRSFTAVDSALDLLTTAVEMKVESTDESRADNTQC